MMRDDCSAAARLTRISLLPNILSNAFLKVVIAFPILPKVPAAAARSLEERKRERERVPDDAIHLLPG